MAIPDSEVRIDGRLIDLIDKEWREDVLPDEDIDVPIDELPEAEQDNGTSRETVKEQEMKWNDLNLQQFLQSLASSQSDQET